MSKICILLLLLVNTASLADNVAIPFLFGYNIEKSSDTEKAALIQSQTIASPFLRSRNGREKNVTSVELENMEVTFRPEPETPWSPFGLPDEGIGYTQYLTQSMEAIQNNVFSLALDGPNISRWDIASGSKNMARCRRSHVSGQVICKTAEMIGSEGRIYPAELSVLDIARIESVMRTFINAITGVRKPTAKENTIREPARLAMLNGLKGGNGLERIAILTKGPDGEDIEVAGARAWFSELYLSQELIKFGQSAFLYVGYDGAKHRLSLLRASIHEVIHVFLKGYHHDTLIFNINGRNQKVSLGDNIELRTVIITNKMLAGIEPPRGFYYSPTLERYRSINEVNIVPGASTQLDLVGDFTRVPENTHRFITGIKMTPRQLADYAYSPLPNKP